MASIESANLKKRKLEDFNEDESSAKVEESGTKIAKTDASLIPSSKNKNDAHKASDKSENAKEEVEKDKVLVTEEKVDLSKDGSIDETNEDATQKPKMGFVFGSTTKFGNMAGFRMFGKKKEDLDVEDVKKDEEQSEKQIDSKEASKNENNVTAKPVFGMGSTFGNAFQAAISKKSVFDDLQPKSAQSTKDDDTTESTTAKDVYKKVDLEKQEVKSGEENEETLFQIKAKVYQIDLADSKMGWKERGFGIIKINKFKERVSELYTSRIVMRQNGNFKLILNVPIVKGFKVLKGIPSSLSADKFIRLQMIENGKPIQYAVKVGQADNALKLFETIEKQIPQ